MGLMAGMCRDVRPRSGPCAWSRLALLATTYLLIVAFVAPLPFTGTAGPAACHSQKSGRHRGTDRPSAAAKVRLSLAADRFRSPEQGTAVAAAPHRTLLLPPVLTPTLSPNPSARTRVFRPLRC